MINCREQMLARVKGFYKKLYSSKTATPSLIVVTDTKDTRIPEITVDKVMFTLIGMN